jgi:hypothetical protein
MKVEEAINEVLGSAVSVVTALPDPQRGEKLVAFYTQNGFSRDVLWSKLNQTGLPKLWIPKRENIHCHRRHPRSSAPASRPQKSQSDGARTRGKLTPINHVLIELSLPVNFTPNDDLAAREQNQ